jgi:hypothetical protein
MEFSKRPSSSSYSNARSNTAPLTLAFADLTGLVANLARPGGNLTGFSNIAIE